MTNADPEVIATVNGLGERRLALEVQMNELVGELEAKEAILKAPYAVKIAALKEQIHAVDSSILEKINDNRSTLIEPGKQSFTTLSAKFQFRKSKGGTKVKDANGILGVARKLGFVRKFFKPPVVVRKLDTPVFLEWLEKNGEYFSRFEPYLEEVPESESLHLQPNGTYAVIHNSKRISPPPVKIGAKS